MLDNGHIQLWTHNWRVILLLFCQYLLFVLFLDKVVLCQSLLDYVSLLSVETCFLGDSNQLSWFLWAWANSFKGLVYFEEYVFVHRYLVVIALVASYFELLWLDLCWMVFGLLVTLLEFQLMWCYIMLVNWIFYDKISHLNGSTFITKALLVPILCCIGLLIRVNLAWAAWHPVSLHLLQFRLQVIMNYILSRFWFQCLFALQTSLPIDWVLALGGIESALLSHLALNNPRSVIIDGLPDLWFVKTLLHDEFFNIHWLKLWVQWSIQLLLILQRYCVGTVVPDQVLASVHIGLVEIIRSSL